jgi:predicted metal-binding membrane protein
MPRVGITEQEDPMKWVVLALFLAGCFAVWRAFSMDATASFERDFPLEIYLGLGGAVAIVVSAAAFLVITFAQL